MYDMYNMYDMYDTYYKILYEVDYMSRRHGWTSMKLGKSDLITS